MEILEIRMKEALLFSFACVGGGEQTHDVPYPKFEPLSEWKPHDSKCKIDFASVYYIRGLLIIFGHTEKKSKFTQHRTRQEKQKRRSYRLLAE